MRILRELQTLNETLETIASELRYIHKELYKMRWETGVKIAPAESDEETNQPS